jgi:D-beta-D-heptose 7-phosphate kinase/D-beta-D-heptose 1-phosphate adenosyltransferase
MQFDSLYRILNGFHAARVLIMGDVMLDRFVYGSVERISPEAPIPVVNVERVLDMPGGAANVARNIAALGARAILLGVVGEDLPAQDLRTQLSCSPNIDARLIVDASRPTSVKTRYVAETQQVMRADRESRAALAADIERNLLEEFSMALRDAAVIVLSDYAKGVLSESVTRAVIDIARRAGKTLIVDPKSKDFAKYRGATVITPNRQELRQACGTECLTDDGVVEGARRILDLGICEALVVTRGKAGMTVIEAGGATVHLPTSARQVFDVSGAGDTAVAAIALALNSGADLRQAADVANIAAGIVVGKRGTATVTTGEIMAGGSSCDGRTDPQKIFALDTVLRLAQSWREQGFKIAFANGCFDLLHPGHISLLDQARRSADRLIVGLNADMSIRRLKGPNRPVQSEVARATVLAAIKSVDAVVIFAEDTPINLIESLRPDVLVKGADYTLDKVVGAEFVMAHGGRVLLVDLLTGHSTSDTVKRVVGG